MVVEKSFYLIKVYDLQYLTNHKNINFEQRKRNTFSSNVPNAGIKSLFRFGSEMFTGKCYLKGGIEQIKYEKMQNKTKGLILI